MRFDKSIYYFYVPVNVLDLDIDLDMKLVYVVLCSYTNSKTDLCYPSVKTMSEKSGLSVRQTVRAIKKLVDIGLIEIVKKGGGRGRKNMYRVIVPGLKEKEEEKKESVLGDLRDEIKDFNLNEDDIKKIESIILEKGEEYVKSAVLYTKNRAKKNKSAYLIQALEKDWARNERKEEEKKNSIERAKREYKKMIGKTVFIKNKEYLVSESGVVGDRDAIPAGLIWENWERWKPILDRKE